MILYIVRHGIAVDRADPKSPPEAERPLTARGVQKTHSAALGLRALKVKPDLLFTSPYVRAAQTAEIVAETLGLSSEKMRVSEALKPAANPADVLKEISHLKVKEVMCFGHAPHVDLLIAHLAGAQDAFTELKKAGVACFEYATSRGKWELRWILTAKILRELGE
ncbi:MAG: phosphohistidine phosphatase SixA [Candidatus Acidiferrales bacterium]